MDSCQKHKSINYFTRLSDKIYEREKQRKLYIKYPKDQFSFISSPRRKKLTLQMYFFLFKDFIPLFSSFCLFLQKKKLQQLLINSISQKLSISFCSEWESITFLKLYLQNFLALLTFVMILEPQTIAKAQHCLQNHGLF